jgi:hypothetical protein
MLPPSAEARTLLGCARSTAERLGMPGWAARADAALAECPASV